MSERAIQQLTEAVDRLVISTDRLASKIDSLLGRVGPTDTETADRVPSSAGASSSVVQVQGVVKELHRTPFPDQFVQYCALQRFRDIEEGPGRAPDYCFAKARELLSEKDPGCEARVRNAYWCGFWAFVAIETSTSFKEKTNLSGLRNNHWVVLRSDRPSAFRTTTLRDLKALCSFESEDLVVGSFDSITEVEIFCLAARQAVPALVSAQ